jgi:hypothetical protein
VTISTPSLKLVSNESHDETAQNQDEASPLYLTLSKNSDRHTEDDQLSHTEKAGWGGLGRVPGYTLNARRRILRAGGALDELSKSPEDCIFLTGTLPGGTEEAKEAIARWSGYAINLVQSWLGKRVPEKLLIYAWEFQKRGALHLHLTMFCPDRDIQMSILSQWKEQWTRVIDQISEKSGVDCWQRSDGQSYANGMKNVLQTDAQRCSKSVAAYLSKYISKQNLKQEEGYEWKYHPSRYWGISRPLCAVITEMTDVEEVLISENSDAEALYEDVLSVAQSSVDKTYSYVHKDSGSKVVLYYNKQNEGVDAWKSITDLIKGASRNTSSTGIDVERFQSRLKTMLMTQVSRLVCLKALWPKFEKPLLSLIETTSKLSKLILASGLTERMELLVLTEHVLRIFRMVAPSSKAVRLLENALNEFERLLIAEKKDYEPA